MGRVRPLEDLLRDTLRSRRGPLPLRRILLLAGGAALAIVLLIAVLSSWYTVDAGSRAVVKRFGRVVDVTGPGLHFKWPLGIETAVVVQTDANRKEEFGFRTLVADRVTQFDSRDHTDESLMLTGDLNVVEVSWVVQYHIVDPDRWLHAMRDPVDTIRDLAESVVRRIVGNRLGSRVLTVGRGELASQVLGELRRILDSYGTGVHIDAVELRDVTPPSAVKPAFNEVNEARQEKERLVNVAEKERNEVLPRARGEAAQTIAEAQAYATERVNEAKGATARFDALLATYLEAPEVTRRRLFFESMDLVLPALQGLVVVDPKLGGPLPLLDLERMLQNKGGR